MNKICGFDEKELMIKAILEKFSKFAFDLPDKKLYMPIGLNSTPPSMIMDQFYPFETEYIVGLLEKELNEINKKEISEDANTFPISRKLSRKHKQGKNASAWNRQI